MAKRRIFGLHSTLVRRNSVSHGGSCVSIDGVAKVVENPENLQGIHEEADTLVAYITFYNPKEVLLFGEQIQMSS